MAQIPPANWLKGKFFLVTFQKSNYCERKKSMRHLAGKIIILRVGHHLWTFTNYRGSTLHSRPHSILKASYPYFSQGNKLDHFISLTYDFTLSLREIVFENQFLGRFCKDYV